MLIEIKDPSKSLEVNRSSRKPKFKFPMNVVLDEFSICVAILC